MSFVLWTVLGCGPPDYDGWQDYLAAVQERFEQDGTCTGLTGLPVSMMSGHAYRADPTEIGKSPLDTLGGVSVYSSGATVGARWTSEPYDEGAGCEAMVAGGGGLWDEFAGNSTARLSAVLSESVELPHLVVSTDPYDLEAEIPLAFTFSYGVSAWESIQVLLGHTYSWACIDSAAGSSGYEAGPASWSGLAFAHAETWTLPDGSTLPGGSTLPDHLGGGELPLDLLLDFADIDCAGSENASWSESPEYCYNWGSQCDGIDNDLDGEIDEGEGLDNDGNGVPDCQDDWDGDGVPNHDDDDVEACCCNY